ncbi:pirin family protein [Hymenobacter jeollabukensis]|uniref:Pirin family protein n=1 Tax=Hymenobacter jeollabukensis TaxID=2025313 RepID=A0A5R8WP32_9BACT|nr:pirin family protein [Hymenobacter jeollabukensis]TLM91794.1 pirin family protein [Hymenobacter jeollabukensis]
MTLRTPQPPQPARAADLDGVPMHHALPVGALEQIDPFLLLDHIGPVTLEPHNAGLPFGPHPHRGFATVTLVLAGAVLHHDSRGNRQTVGAGGVQWMTAARGIIHAENLPRELRETGGELELLQLWINLPAALKMEQPAYQGLPAERLPQVVSDEGRARLTAVAGNWPAAAGPAQPLHPVQLALLQLQAGGRYEWRVDEPANAFVYAVRGTVRANNQPLQTRELLPLAADGDTVELRAEADALLLLGAAAPLNEPLARQGPFVMNTTTQLMEAVRDYQMGRMGMLMESETR